MRYFRRATDVRGLGAGGDMSTVLGARATHDVPPWRCHETNHHPRNEQTESIETVWKHLHHHYYYYYCWLQACLYWLEAVTASWCPRRPLGQ